MTEQIKDKAESIRHRLRNRLRERGEDLQFGLQRYAIERFLYRVGLSAQRDCLVLKGAALFALWGGSVYRPTRDLDFTAYGNPDQSDVIRALREICLSSKPTDEITFNPETLSAEPIRDDSEYTGLRVRLEATLGTSRIPMQIDIGFGNAIEPRPEYTDYPTLLDDPAPRILSYPPEAVIAEKLHAMVMLGERNSRYKDFYDLHALARQFQFDGERLARAIAVTFERRRTLIAGDTPIALIPRFFADEARALQWRTYRERNHLPGAPADFDSVGEVIRSFLGPVWSALAENVSFAGNWAPGAFWNFQESDKEILAAGTAPTSTTADEQKYSKNAEARDIEDLEIPIAAPLRRFTPHPAYKDSGVEWLGEIPADWQVKKIKRLCLVRRGASPRPIEDPIYFDDEGEYAWVRIADVTGSARYLESTTQRLSALGKSRSVSLEPGELFLSIAATVGKPIITKIKCCIHDGFVYFVGLRENRDYLYYVFSCGEPYKGLGKLGTQLNLNTDTIGDIFLPIPPDEEQRAIAGFLDRETAKIDALVAKKERLIELLQEKRAALIARAVTKGLDPNVAMRDSGVEWLGEIPAHWDVSPVYARYEVSLGKMLDAKRFTGEFLGRYLRNVDVQWDHVNTEDLPEMDFAAWERDRYLLRPGDLLVCEGGEVGRTAIWHGEINECYYQKAIHRVRPRSNTDSPRFFYYLMYALAKHRVFVAGGNPNTIDHLTAVQLRHYRLPFAPPEEQYVIADFLDRETVKIDELMSQVCEGIGSLKELRTALISAAVTGKIDVREAVS